MTAREISETVQSAARATLIQLPVEVLAALEVRGIAIGDLSRAIGNNAAQAIALSEDE